MKTPSDEAPGLPAHEETIESLPWLVNGTLDAASAATVHAHLADCAECRERTAFDQALADGLREERTVDYAPHAGYAKFAARLDADEALERRWDAWRRWLPQFALPWNPRPLHVLVAAQTAAIVLLAAGLVLQPWSAPAPKEYRALSQPQPALGAGPAVRLVVDDSMNTRQLRETLQRIHAHIVGGPSELGVLTVQVDRAPDARREDAMELARWLRDQPGVLFAEPVEGGGP